jgi:hypothetical protein
VISIFGRAGYQDYYKSKQINMIGFIIFDKSTCKMRTFGVSDGRVRIDFRAKRTRCGSRSGTATTATTASLSTPVPRSPWVDMLKMKTPLNVR